MDPNFRFALSHNSTTQYPQCETILTVPTILYYSGTVLIWLPLCCCFFVFFFLRRCPAGLPWERNFNSHSHPIPTGFPWEFAQVFPWEFPRGNPMRIHKEFQDSHMGIPMGKPVGSIDHNSEIVLKFSQGRHRNEARI